MKENMNKQCHHCSREVTTPKDTYITICDDCIQRHAKRNGY